jgi:hypothetical protein
MLIKKVFVMIWNSTIESTHDGSVFILVAMCEQPPVEIEPRLGIPE